LWAEITHDRVLDVEYILAESDSTTSTGWLYTSNFVDDDKHTVFRIARQMDHMLLEANVCLHLQWFVGILNTVTDSFSRDLNISDGKITTCLILVLPKQAPHHFKINQLPSTVNSFLIYLFQEVPMMQR
jgi:hypothetical protein